MIVQIQIQGHNGESSQCCNIIIDAFRSHISSLQMCTSGSRKASLSTHGSLQ